MAQQMDRQGDFFIVGVSFGGMIAVELSRLVRYKKLILISSAKTSAEIPWSLQFFRYFPVYRLFSDRFIYWLSAVNKHRFGIFKEEEKRLFADMLAACPKGYLRAAMRMILSWKNKEYPVSVVHIHGDKDYLLPIRLIRDPVVIRGGTHFMPFHCAAEVEQALQKALAE